MDLAKLHRESRRLFILQFLTKLPGYGGHEALLRDGLAQIPGVACGRDLMRTELAWLAEQGLIELRLVEGLQIATLTARGEDVAKGLTITPGVKRPEPHD